jgi:SHS family sialic acid transporter-like MFS transporter
MESFSHHHRRQRISQGQWLVLIGALLGWMFDGMEMGVFSLVGRSALGDLLHTSDESVIGFWFGAVTAGFLVGAAAGGVLFGWLGDRIGRVRAMSLSVLTYAVFTSLCGLADSAEQIAALRFIAALGMGGEYALGVALVMESWPNHSRVLLSGLIGAAGNAGYLVIALVGFVLTAALGDIANLLTATGMSSQLIDRLTGHSGWRLLMISGVAPALLTFLIRQFVPESKRWQRENERGATLHWAARDLIGVGLGTLGPLAIIYLWATENISLSVRVLGTLLGLAVALYGYLYPVIRYAARLQAATSNDSEFLSSTLRRMFLAAGLSGVALLGSWGAMQWAPTWADKLTGGQLPAAKGWTQVCSASGAMMGCMIAALASGLLSRRATYRVICIGAFASILLMYRGNHEFGPKLLASVFVAGMCSASFYGWLPLYLPELFRTNVRATGPGFGYNFGRVLAAIGVLQTGNLMGLFGGNYAVACSVMSGVYIIGLVLIQFAPETRGKPLPD